MKISNLWNLLALCFPMLGNAWTIDSQSEWEQSVKSQAGIEFKDGKAYFYYDFPNDQDPHLIIDDDLTDGEVGERMGMAFEDPSHGSDCAFIRDLDGNFHVIYEDWSPIHANSHSFDSPLAGHAVSKDGKGDFKILPPAVDKRTTPTGVIKTYKHPHWVKECPERFTSSSLDEEFEFCGHVGHGHPDPDVCFAEGRFWLATQPEEDFVSPGPWVESVEVRVGVDTDNDAVIDEWTSWEEVKERYDYTSGFAKQVAKEPAVLDRSGRPAGTGFQLELKLIDTTKNKSKPIIDTITFNFGQ